MDSNKLMIGLGITALGAFIVWKAYGLCSGNIDDIALCVVTSPKVTIFSVIGVVTLWNGVDRVWKEV